LTESLPKQRYSDDDFMDRSTRVTFIPGYKPNHKPRTCIHVYFCGPTHIQ